MSRPNRSEAKTTDNLEQQRSGKSRGATPATSMSLDAMTKGSKGPRSKVHQALAIAASINNNEMKGCSTTSGSATTCGNGSQRGGATRNNGGGKNAEGINGSSESGADYESSKATSKKDSATSRREAEEMRQMVADLDRFDANDENDNMEDSF